MYGKIKIDKELCKGCMLCIVTCPTKVITISNKFNSKGLNYAIPEKMENCTGCTLCAIICPDVAIEVYKE